MPIRKIELNTDTYYHVYNRGFNKQTLFYNHRDYTHFYKTIQRYLIENDRIKIMSYCFLPNHFHFLLCEDKSPDSMESGLKSEQISNFMRKIQQAYAMYFNVVYGKSVKMNLKSPVFEGRFKAKEIDSEDYLGQLQVYIEHNAVKHELVDRAEDWPWTSYQPGAGRSPDSIESGLKFNSVFE